MSRKSASARPGQDRASLYDEITGKIIAELEAGRVPWVCIDRRHGGQAFGDIVDTFPIIGSGGFGCHFARCP